MYEKSPNILIELRDQNAKYLSGKKKNETYCSCDYMCVKRQREKLFKEKKIRI